MKKVIILISIFLTLSVLLIIAIINDNKEPLSNDSFPDNEVVAFSPEQVINEVVFYAKQGKVFHSSFVAGSTKIDEVEILLGDPQSEENTIVGKYIYYPSQKLSLGIDGNLIFDVRSYDEKLNKVHLQDIKNILGEPEKTTYYKDETTNQVILYYTLNDNYLLKWVLPEPTTNVPNPEIHHISVITKDNPTKYANLVANMTLEEKIGQMFFIGISSESIDEMTKHFIKEKNVGGIIFFKDNLNSSLQIVTLLNEIKLLNKDNSIPLFLGIDQEGGNVNRLPKEILSLPTNHSIGIVNDEMFAYEIGTILGKQLATFGFNVNFAPVLDVDSNPNNPVIGKRSFSHDPLIVSKLGLQVMKGIQSENIIPVIKHFPGHGDTSADSHLQLPVVNKSFEELASLELIPFKKAINEGADMVMVAHILLPQIDNTAPASLSKTIITDILRENLEFNGVVVTDDMTMKAITNHYSIQEAAVLSVKAGSDILLIAHDEENILIAMNELISAVQSGEITEQRINESVVRILRLKQLYELNSSPIDDINIEELNNQIKTTLNKYNS